MIKAEIIADSKNEFGNRITTMIVTMPRIILAEFNTHRMFSRNSASSRAIPFEKMVKSVEENPFIPIAWQKDHKGMQGTEYFQENETFISENPMDRFANGITKEDGSAVRIIGRLKAEWLWARDMAVQAAINLNNCGVKYHPNGDTSKLTGDGRGLTKQLCNRLLEPFMWHTVLITATEWENFFALRCPQYVEPLSNKIYRSKKDLVKETFLPENRIKEQHLTDNYFRKINKGQAEIHMMALAEAMWDAYNESTPKQLRAGEWHIPFGDNIKPETYEGYEEWSKRCIKIATARCARVSYTVVGEEDKPNNYENDIKLHDRLAESGHWSPFEHCAKAMNEEEWVNYINGIQSHRTTGITNDIMGWSGNFRGFIQYRKMFDNENISK